MKNRAIFICLLMFCCFWFMGCDEFGVLNIMGTVYFSLPNTDMIELQWNVGKEENINYTILNRDFVYELQIRYPKEEFFQNFGEYPIYSFFVDEYLETRKNFMLTVSVRYKNDIYSGNIIIPYVKNEGEIIHFSLFSQENEKIDGIFIYEFWQFI